MAERGDSARDRILDAAQRVATKRGAGHITLDEVARESGLSKGGLLYHFPGKEALIQGMLERLIERTSELRKAEPRQADNGGHHTLLAMLRTRNREDVLDPHVVTAILAAAAEQPELLAPLRNHIATLRAEIIAEAGDEPLYWLLWAASDGLVLQEALGITPYPAEQREQVRRKLLAVAEELLP